MDLMPSSVVTLASSSDVTETKSLSVPAAAASIVIARVRGPDRQMFLSDKIQYSQMNYSKSLKESFIDIINLDINVS